MRHIVIGTAGHIDHGKSALVRALTGIDPDRLKEEKARGITIDLGFAHYEAGGVTYAFVDVPGHERFVKNMLAGVSGIDGVLFVVAADESVMPQTREHFDICRLLRIDRGVMALTKADLVDEDTLELVRLEVRELTAGSALERAPLVAVSATTGTGLDLLRSELAALAAGASTRRTSGPVRLPIDRVFSVRGFGTVITGTLASGRIRIDDELVTLPAGRHTKVRGIQVHGVRQPAVEAGQRAAVNLAGVDVAELSRGETLVAPGAFEATRRFDAVIELLASARPLRHGARVRFHCGTSELLGRVALAGPLDPADAAAPAAELAPGARAFARLRLERPAVLTRGDRFILRAYSPPITIAGGEVIDPLPARGPLRTASARARFDRLRPAPGRDRAVATFVEERGAAALAVGAVVSRAGVAPDDVPALLARLEAARLVVRTSALLVAASTVRQLEARLLEELERHHRTTPLSDGLPREEARERVAGRSASEVFDLVVDRLVGAGTIQARDRLAMATHRVALSADEARARDRIEQLFRDRGLTPPDQASLAAAAASDEATVGRVVGLLVRQKVLVRLDALLFHTDTLDRLKAEVRGMKAAGLTRVDVAAFKERYGITRKHAIPLLEYLDRERITRRVGDSRIVL